MDDKVIQVDSNESNLWCSAQRSYRALYTGSDLFIHQLILSKSQFTHIFQLDFTPTFTMVQASTIVSIVIFPAGVIAPFLFTYKLFRERKNLETENFEQKFGPLTELLDASTITKALWNILTLYRWMITIAILILLQNYPSLQVAPLLFMSLLSLAYQILVKPFKDPIDRKMNIFYEILASIYLYCFLALAFCPDSQTIGWCLQES